MRRPRKLIEMQHKCGTHSTALWQPRDSHALRGCPTTLLHCHMCTWWMQRKQHHYRDASLWKTGMRHTTSTVRSPHTHTQVHPGITPVNMQGAQCDKRCVCTRATAAYIAGILHRLSRTRGTVHMAPAGKFKTF